MLRWLLLGLGIVAIGILSTSTGFSDRHVARRPVTIALDPDAVEPAPLVFQPDIAPKDAEAINAARADYTGPIVAARPFVTGHAPERHADILRATDCLTQAIYYEAASETAEGQRAVAQVVLNRVRDPRFPASVCGVVFQGAERSTGCQFTFACDGALARKPIAAIYERARVIAVAALNGRVEPLVGLATHYHTRQVVPVWRTDLVKLRTVGAHIFYGWRGREKSARGLRTAYAGLEPVIFPAETAPGSPPDTVQTLYPGEDTANPFAAPSPDTGLTSPRLPVQDFGRLHADDTAGQLVVSPSSGLAADAPSELTGNRQ